MKLEADSDLPRILVNGSKRIDSSGKLAIEYFSVYSRRDITFNNIQ